MTWFALTLFACFEPAPDGPDRPPDGSAEVVLVPEDPDAPAPPRPVDARIAFVGTGLAAPSRIAVQLDRAAFPPTELGTTPASYTIRVEPEVAGAFTVAAVDRLEFVPAAPLRPATTYTVTVESPTAEPPAGPWTAETTTPEFALVRATMWKIGPPGGPVVVDLVFSGAVEAAAVRRALKVTVGEQAVDAKIEPGAAPNIVSVSLVRPTFPGDLRLALADRRVSWAGDPKLTAPAAEQRVALGTDGPAMQVLHARLEEGQDGFYVEIICDDDASVGEKRWRYEYGWPRGFEVSPRCELDEDYARAMVHTEPEVDLEVAPAGAGFRVFGKFPRGPLKLVVDAGVRTVDGGVLRNAFEHELTVPARSPRARFADQGRYLPRDAWKNVAVRHLNADRLGFEVRHVPPENLVFWLTGEEPTDRRTSDRVASVVMPVPNRADEEITSWIDVRSLVPEPAPGIYELKIGSGGPGSAARVLLTDLHLVAKAAAPRPGQPWTPNVRVWALDVHSGDALSGVEVDVIRASGKSLARCTTKGVGGCELALPLSDVDDSPPIALVARKGTDLTYVEFEDLRLDLPDDATGEPYAAVAAYKAPMWTDRGAYRPGDVAHVAAVVRDAAFVAPPADLPVVVRLFDPKEREARKKVAKTNAAGMVAADFRFGDYAATGRYRVVTEVGGHAVGETTFLVEEFVPERLKVVAQGPAKGIRPEEEADIQVSGQWLFGGSAVGSKVEVACRLVASPFHSPDYPAFSFGPAWLGGKPNDVTLGAVEGELDEAGLATVACPAPGAGALAGPSEVVADAAVFEGESGRTTVGQASTRVHAERYYVGLDTSAVRATEGAPLKFQGVVVDTAGHLAKKTPASVQVEVFRMEEEYSWYYDDHEGSSSHQRRLRASREQELDVAVADGRFTFEVVPGADSAGTLVRVRSGQATAERFVEGTGRRYGWEEGQQQVDVTPRPMRPAPLPIEVTGPVRVGEVVPVVAQAPYAGKILFTVETDEVLDAVWMDASPGPNEWRFRLDRFTPNVYVSALLVKDPHLESAEAFLPDRAFGVRSAKVEPSAYARTLTVDAPDEVRPYGPLTVEVALSGPGPAFATIAAVDEGILSLTRFPDPDPLGTLFAQRALGVSSFETVGWTRMVSAAGPSSSTGGDAEEAGGGSRVQMVKPVALWSGVVALDEQGKGRVTFDVPGYRGKLRIMAVAATPDGLGQASDAVVVREPLVLMTTLPRFLLAGDEVHVPVQVTNTTSSKKDVVVRLEASELHRGAVPDVTVGDGLPPPFTFLGAPEGTLSLAPGASQTAVFRVRVRSAPGAARLLVTATSGKTVSREELDVPIQVARSEVREIETLAIAGARVDVKPVLAGWVDGTDKSTVWVTTNPYAESLTQMRHLIHYPYG